ncbi:hypothetical protein DSL64_03645 [Dyadobacter luteus]|uniref:Uncharacterized protein n=1 Tax=Dyadobacter luteus TaxID=2259619 RepID=A0A3D8YFR7_9BACT|nr:hypothetical protein DSL64_03645 [Dyadobacter luteus]
MEAIGSDACLLPGFSGIGILPALITSGYLTQYKGFGFAETESAKNCEAGRNTFGDWKQAHAQRLALRRAEVICNSGNSSEDIPQSPKLE